MSNPTPASKRRFRPSERGMALIVVFTTIAILSTSIIEYVYNTRVNLYLAQNQRDEVKAYFLARSGVSLTRLALAYQGELEGQGGFIGNAISRSNFQLWQYLDLLLPTFSSGALDADQYGAIDLEEQGASGFGDIHGSIEFQRPEPEEGKININAFGSRNLDQAQLLEFCSLLRPPQYDEMMGFDQRDELQSRFEVIAAIIDHIDPDTDLTVIDDNCIATVGGAGNEASRYQDVSWEPKNEPLITLDELLLVPGVTDAFMQQFRHNLTVYPVPGQFYPNLADAQSFAGFLCAHIVGANEDVSPCVIPQIAEQVAFLALALEGYVEFFANPFNVLSLWVGGNSSLNVDEFGSAMGNGQMMAFKNDRDFTSALNLFMSNQETAIYFMSFADPQRAALFGYAAMQGIELIPPDFAVTFDEAAMLRRVSTEVPRIFTIEATGVYGGATRTITTVVDMNREGRLLYWREY